MNVIGIIYAQYSNAKTKILVHLTLLKAYFCFEKEFDHEGLKVLALLNEHKLDMGASLFKVTM
jgi:hypothetical protein